MRTYRRQRQQYLFATVLAVIAAINLLFFLILFRPVRSEYFTLQDSIEKARSDVQSRTQRIEQLEKLNAQLETFSQDQQKLFTLHFIPRNAGWSEIVPQLNTMVQQAGVKNTRKEYAIDQNAQYGLYSVKIRVPVTGPYPNVVNFIKDLEESETFFIINSTDVQGSNLPGGSADVNMSLSLETFFYQ